MKVGGFVSRLCGALLVAAALLAPVVEAREARPARDRRGGGGGTAERNLTDREISHLLNRATFGATLDEIARVREMGLTAWLDEQLHPERIADPELDARLAIYPSLDMTIEELLTEYPDLPPGVPSPPGRAPNRILVELNAGRMTRAVHAKAQLQEVLVDFWLNHFNVFGPTGQTRWTISTYERESIRPYALGKFEDLLRANAQAPAMLFYLDNYLSVLPGSRGANSGYNENYARELLELHTMGVDGGYSQDDVISVAAVLTGWTTTAPRSGAINFVFVPRWHDSGSKRVLGVDIPEGGIEQGLTVLRMLAVHPSTARFVSRKLAQRFVHDRPPESLVERAAQTFTQTGGDIREVVRTILTSDEFFDPAVRYAKTRTPLDFVAAALRASGADVRTGYNAVRSVDDLGQPMLQCSPPTGYPEDTASLVSASAMLSRFDTARNLAANRIDGSLVNTAQWDEIMRRPRGFSSRRLLRHILRRPVSSNTRLALRLATEEGADAATLAALVFASPEFQEK